MLVYYGTWANATPEVKDKYEKAWAAQLMYSKTKICMQAEKMGYPFSTGAFHNYVISLCKEAENAYLSGAKVKLSRDQPL